MKKADLTGSFYSSSLKISSTNSAATQPQHKFFFTLDKTSAMLAIMKARHLLPALLFSTICWGNEPPPPALPVTESTTDFNISRKEMQAVDYLPADADNFIAINTAAWRKLSAQMGSSENDRFRSKVESVAIGIPSQTAGSINCITDLAGTVAGNLSSVSVLTFWRMISHESVARLQEKAAQNIKLNSPQEIRLDPLDHFKIYIAIQTAPGQENICEQLICSHENQNAEHVEMNGWKGLQFSARKALKDATLSPEEEQFAENLNLCLMHRTEGNCTILALCCKPEVLHPLSTSPDAAIGKLPLDFAAEMANTHNTPLIIAGINPPILNSLQHLLKQICRVIEAPLLTTFTAVANSDYPAAAEVKKGLTALDVIAAELSKLTPPIQRPLHLAMWHSPNDGGHLKIKAEWDACGISFAEDSIRTIPHDKSTAFSLCCSPLHIQNPPDFAKICSAGADVYDAFLHTINPTPHEQQTEAEAALHELGSTIRPIYDSFKAFSATLGDSWSFYISSEHTFDADSDGTPAMREETSSALVINLQDRAMLLPTWRAFMQTVEQELKTEETEEPPVPQPEYAEHTEGNITFFTDKEDNSLIAITNDDIIITDCHLKDTLLKHNERHAIKGLYASIHFEPLFYAMENYEAVKPLIDTITGGKLHLTTENGDMKLNIDIPCPGIPQAL